MGEQAAYRFRHFYLLLAVWLNYMTSTFAVAAGFIEVGTWVKEQLNQCIFLDIWLFLIH